ncbi:hypothetical protein [Streptomyces sp. NPDC006997]|uniref:hypothetical protein n=1 Tax=Streptomyces sp. NPDC006997 TaxID=3155356 RepID=UPI0033BFBDDB
MTACGLCERELHGDRAGHFLCGSCARATGERLARMTALYRTLALFLHPSGRRTQLGRTHSAEAGLPVAEPVLVLRGPGGMCGVLEDWRTALHADLGWPPPRPRGSTEDRIARAVRGLSDNLLWVASSWPPAGAFAEEVRDLERTVLRIVDPPEPALRIGPCPALLPDGSTCGALLSVPAGTSKVACAWCGTHYPPTTWLTLASGQWASDDTPKEATWPTAS